MKVYIPVYEGGHAVWEVETSSRFVETRRCGVAFIRGCVFDLADTVYRSEAAARCWWRGEPVPAADCISLAAAMKEA